MFAYSLHQTIGQSKLRHGEVKRSFKKRRLFGAAQSTTELRVVFQKHDELYLAASLVADSASRHYDSPQAT